MWDHVYVMKSHKESRLRVKTHNGALPFSQPTMAFQLNQLVAPAHYPGLSFPALTNPSNPPTTQDVYDAVIYSMRVLADDSLRSTGVRAQCVAEAKRYEYAIIAAYTAKVPPGVIEVERKGRRQNISFVLLQLAVANIEDKIYVVDFITRPIILLVIGTTVLFATVENGGSFPHRRLDLCWLQSNN
ncbi:hypothetical protein CPB85DRAFT_1252637 [Mucidula mucida]|nr:hypothetical protein CPB85DRAFT_1252637 [Mucidula mucida]